MNKGILIYAAVIVILFFLIRANKKKPENKTAENAEQGSSSGGGGGGGFPSGPFTPPLVNPNFGIFANPIPQPAAASPAPLTLAQGAAPGFRFTRQRPIIPPGFSGGSRQRIF